jgi:hypothetical protein
MSSDNDDEHWFETYPKNTFQVLSLSGYPAEAFPMTTETKLPYRHKAGKGQVYVIYNDLTITFNGNRLTFGFFCYVTFSGRAVNFLEIL